MEVPFSRRAGTAAAALFALHAGAAAYVHATSMAYDRGDALGLLWWLVALGVLPVVALAVLVVSFVRHILNLSNNRH